MSNLVFGFNSVAPVFLLVGIGWLAKRAKLVDDRFIAGSSKLNFKTGLPALLFLSIYQQESTGFFDWNFVGFMVGIHLAFALVLCLTVPRLVADRRRASALIHSAFKPNIIVLGFPLMQMTFGQEHMGPASMLMPILVPLNNVAAVVILCILDPENRSGSMKEQVCKALLGILKNPLILSAAAALLLLQFRIQLPEFLTKGITSLSDMATPLALLTLGAQMTMESVRSDRKFVLSAVACKLLAMPLILVSLAFLAGFRGYELATAFIVAASPSAVNSYMLAREMHSDEVLTGEAILFGTLCSMFILFFGICLLRSLGVIL